jgi:putative oxidoreductase
MGILKIMGFAGVVGYAAALGAPLPQVAAVIVIIIELGGGLLLIFNKYRKIAVYGLAAWLIIVSVWAHNDLSNQMNITMILKNIAMLGGVMLLCSCNRCTKDACESCCSKA